VNFRRFWRVLDRSKNDQGLDAAAVAGLLRELGQRLELTADSPFKAKDYYRAAESLGALTEPLGDVIRRGRLREVPGVGPAIAEKIVAIHETGTHRMLERLRSEVPSSALELLTIPGLSTAKVRQIVKEHGIQDIGELEKACRADKLAGIRGFGPALQRKILDGIEMRRRGGGQRLIHHAEALLSATAANLARSHPDLEQITPAGDFRRGCELVHHLALVARVKGLGDIRTASANKHVELTVADEPRYGVALLLATGSAAHVEALRALAQRKRLSLGTNGLKRGKNLIPCPTEEDVYAALGLPFIPPELREGADEVALAMEGRLPSLVEAGDIRGILHCHTDRSDGVNTLEEMAEATRERGYAYFGVADHSRSAGYAGGLSVEEIEAQHAEIDRLNRRWRGKFRILKGIESDILPDGSLDYPDEVLSRFDFVVASVHSRFRMSRAEQTERILRAVSNPHTTILGHMTGRMLLRREGYELDIDRVLQACAEHGVAVEINANPHRLDLDWRWHRRALELGCMFSINPDAHSIAELDLMRWGIAMARKGGVPRERVLNCMEAARTIRFMKQKGSRKKGPARRTVAS
jgi:DNA polymerase (family 10)